MEYNKQEEKYIEIIDKAISELVYEKTQMIKAYNYYHGKRDPQQFRHLEVNYGIGTPTSVEFVPLVRKHIDVLVGEYLTIPLIPKVSCKDRDTISKITQEKLEHINNEISKVLKENIKKLLRGEQLTEKLIDSLEEIKENLEDNFISQYEIAAQNIVTHSIQSRLIDFIVKRKLILIDLLVTGTCYYRTLESPSNTSVDLQALNPLHTFIERNINSPYSKHSRRAVVRSYLTKSEILEKYGDLLKKEDIESLEDSPDDPEYRFLNSLTTHRQEDSDGILAGWEVSPGYSTESSDNFSHSNRYVVYDVEWLQTDKEKNGYITNRYRGIRISNDIYILLGKVENVIRTKDNPKTCSLSINGTFFADRNGEPFSLILATASLQDKFDVLNFYKDNIIAESGTKGDWIDVAYLPTFLGSNLTERLMKWKAYKKQGMGLLDSSQAGTPPMNTTFGGYDDTLKFDTIQAIEMAIQTVEQTCSTITGVFREKLGGIEQRDAVSNVQVGIRQSSYITKQFYHIMDVMTREMLVDILDVSKIVYKNGVTGSLILGDRYNKIFTALPEHYTMTDYDIHIADTSEIIQEFEIMKQLGMELSRSGQVDAEILVEVLTAKSLTKMKYGVKDALQKKSEEMNAVAQLQQQLQNADTEIQQLQKQLQQTTNQLQKFDQEKQAFDKEKFQKEYELEWYKAKNDKAYQDQKIKLDHKHIEAEVLELYDDNPHNDEIKNKR